MTNEAFPASGRKTNAKKASKFSLFHSQVVSEKIKEYSLRKRKLWCRWYFFIKRRSSFHSETERRVVCRLKLETDALTSNQRRQILTDCVGENTRNQCNQQKEQICYVCTPQRSKKGSIFEFNKTRTYRWAENQSNRLDYGTLLVSVKMLRTLAAVRTFIFICETKRLIK